MKLFSLFFCALIAFSCTQNKEDVAETKSIIAETGVESEKETVDELVIEKPIDDYSAKATFSPDHGWGYQILNNGELYINQPHIPSIPGNNGFETEENALKTANFVIYKLNNGIVPPTVSPEDLDSLGVM